MKHRFLVPGLLAVCALLPREAAAGGKSLRGSPASMLRQNEVAKDNDYAFLRTPKQVAASVQAGQLVRLPGNDDYRLEGATYPYGRPEVKLFVEQLSSEYHAACGEQLVVTSVTRPLSRQPRNAHPLSVHPAGMAVDLRVSRSSICVNWLQNTLLSLEEQDLLDVTREFRPAHLHVAVFPTEYREHVERLLAEQAALLPPDPAPALPASAPTVAASMAPRPARNSRWQWLLVSTVMGSAAAALFTFRRKSSPRM